MDIGSLYTDYYAKAATDAQNKKLSSTASKDLSGASDEELMEVCKDFESYFVEQVLKQAMETFTEGDEMSSGSMTTLQGYYRDNLIKEYAGKMTENQDFGLAKTLYEQMKRNYSPDPVKKADDVETTQSKTDDTNAVEAASTILAEDE